MLTVETKPSHSQHQPNARFPRAGMLLPMRQNTPHAQKAHRHAAHNITISRRHEKERNEKEDDQCEGIEPRA